MQTSHPPTTSRSSASTPALFAGRMMQDERLGSTFNPSASNSMASTSQSGASSRSSSVRRRDDADEGAPPRKKLNVGQGNFTGTSSSTVASSATTRQSTPDSLQGVRSGVKAITVTDISSASPSPDKPRGKLVRGRQLAASSSSSSAPGTPNLAVKQAGSTFKNQTPLDHLIKGNPNVPANEIQRHYHVQGGDANRTIAALGGMHLLLQMLNTLPV